MNVLILMIPISLVLGASFLWAFVWGVNTGQNDDLVTPAYRILEEDDKGDTSDRTNA